MPKDDDFDGCWNCGKSLGIKLVGCCSGRDCGCMGWPTEYPFCDPECHKQWQYNRQEQRRLDDLKPIKEGDDLPF